MNALPLPLTTRNFGEWLAALGLLRVANALAPGSTLHFDDEGRAILATSATERQLVGKIIASANPASVKVRLHTPLANDEPPGASSVRIGDSQFAVREAALDDPAVARNDDAKAGLFLRFEALGGLEVSHFLSKAMTDCAELKSPLKMWAGTVLFSTILQHVASFVAGQPPDARLADVIGQRRRSPQRWRFDHADEQFVEDGGHEISDEGRETRPVVEWLGLIGLSFFPPEAGFAGALGVQGQLRAPVWHQPLGTSALLLSLHAGHFAGARTFAIASDGKFKKIRPAGAGRSITSHSPI